MVYGHADDDGCRAGDILDYDGQGPEVRTLNEQSVSVKSSDMIRPFTCKCRQHDRRQTLVPRASLCDVISYACLL